MTGASSVCWLNAIRVRGGNLGGCGCVQRIQGEDGWMVEPGCDGLGNQNRNGLLEKLAGLAAGEKSSLLSPEALLRRSFF